MKPVVLAATLVLTTPAIAQEAEPDGLMERGLRMFMEGLFEEMEPAMRDLQDLAEQLEPAMRDFVTTMGPALQDLTDQIDDWALYEVPEVLPNGDIIIRRKPDARPLAEQDDTANEIEL